MIGRGDIPYPDRGAGQFHQLSDRARHRRRAAGLIGGALSDLCTARHRPRRRRAHLLPHRPDVLARQSHGAGAQHAATRRTRSAGSTSSRRRSTARSRSRSCSASSAMCAWTWNGTPHTRRRQLVGAGAERAQCVSADRHRPRRSRRRGAGDVCADPGNDGCRPRAASSWCFIAATLLGFASHAPAGIGVFDATILVGLGGEHTEQLLAVLLLFRLFYHLIPFVLSLACSARGGFGLWRDGSG